MTSLREPLEQIRCVDEPVPLRGSKIVVAYNPRAGSGRRRQQVEGLVDFLRREAFDILLCETIDSLLGALNSIPTDDLRLVVAAGGDGTIAFALNQLPVGVPLAIFPLGTENLLARYLGYSRRAEELAPLFREGQVLGFDAATANGRLFSLMAGVGFDAEVVERLHASRTGNISHLSYLMPLWSVARNYSYPRLTVEVLSATNDWEKFEGAWAFVSNVPMYAGGLCFSPQASARDGLLDLCLFPEGSLWSGVRYLTGVMRGVHAHWPDVVHRQTTRLRITASEAVAYQLDGDPGGKLPVEIAVVPRRLSMVVSPTSLRRRAAW